MVNTYFSVLYHVSNGPFYAASKIRYFSDVHFTRAGMLSDVVWAFTSAWLVQAKSCSCEHHLVSEHKYTKSEKQREAHRCKGL